MVNKDAVTFSMNRFVENKSGIYLIANKGVNTIERIFLPCSFNDELPSIVVYNQFKRFFVNGASGITKNTPYDINYLGAITSIGGSIEQHIKTLIQTGFSFEDEPVVDFFYDWKEEDFL